MEYAASLELDFPDLRYPTPVPNNNWHFYAVNYLSYKIHSNSVNILFEQIYISFSSIQSLIHLVLIYFVDAAIYKLESIF